MSDTARRIAELLNDLPRAGTDDATRAAWFDRKAALFTDIAEKDETLAEEATHAADRARLEARRLRRGGDAP